MRANMHEQSNTAHREKKSQKFFEKILMKKIQFKNQLMDTKHAY